jgi:MoxR-like ATPase
MAGEKKTSPEDLSILTDSLWREPKDRAKVARLVCKLADPVGAEANEIIDARETAAKIAGLQPGDRKQYIAAAAQGLEQFQAQQKKLGQLAKAAGLPGQRPSACSSRGLPGRRAFCSRVRGFEV